MDYMFDAGYRKGVDDQQKEINAIRQSYDEMEQSYQKDKNRMADEITALREKVAILEGQRHAEAFGLIAAERARQDEKWGYPQLNTYSEWAGILAEECGECCAELNELNFGRGNVDAMIEEAVQVAAVAVSIIEHLEPAQDITIRMGAARVAAVEIDRGGLATAT